MEEDTDGRMPASPAPGSPGSAPSPQAVSAFGSDPIAQGHVPGPWRVYQGRSSGRVFHHGRTVIAPLSEGEGADSMAVAYCDYHSPRIAEANARLIAAAPDLLAACLEFIPILDRQLKSINPGGAAEGSTAFQVAKARVERMRAAIAKAEGR